MNQHVGVCPLPVVYFNLSTSIYLSFYFSLLCSALPLMMAMVRPLFLFFLFSILLPFAPAGMNGMAMRPPMTWRSWNSFATQISSSVILRNAQGLVDESRAIRNMPPGSSLRSLGYAEVGADEGWAMCAPPPGYPPNDYMYHKGNADGSISPQINVDLFPDMAGLVAAIHALGLRAGWYLNDCLSPPLCFKSGDTCSDECTPGDVAALNQYGFDSVKLDGCSKQHNISQWASLLNVSSAGPQMIIENCHVSSNPAFPISAGGCPFYHLYRTSTDIRNTYGSFVANAQTVLPFLDGRHGPTCWAYPDMSMVGVSRDINGQYFPPTLTEQRTHFGLWCILSAPLTLSLDLSNNTAVNLSWVRAQPRLFFSGCVYLPSFTHYRLSC